MIINQNRKKQEVVRAQNANHLGETNCLSEETERKVLHTMEVMARRNLTLIYKSKKRMIFEMWRTVLKEEKAFAYSVRNVIMKSLFQEGFTRIKYQSRDVDFTEKVHRALKRFSLKGGRIKMGDSFTKWKKFAFSSVDDATNEIAQELHSKVTQFQEFRNAAQEKNLERVTNFFIEKNQANIFKAWRNVIKHFILVKAKTVEFKTRQSKLQRIAAIQKWRMRTDKTKECKQKEKVLISQYHQLYLRACFRGWKFHFRTTQSLTNSIHHLERTMRTKIYGDAFGNIKTFSNSKKKVIQQNHSIGGHKTGRLLKGIYLKALNIAFQKYKSKCFTGSEANQCFKSVFGKQGNARLRDAFYWWKKKHALEDLAQEMHETGPVRAQHWLAEKDIENMKQFMRDQHYTELEINKFYNDVCGYNDYLMKKHMIRMKYKLDPNKRLLPIVMDRWRGFVQIRKSVKHQFRFLGNFKEAEKAEMQIAFNKWKRGSNKLEEELWRLDYNTLE